jgi:hypothetical protein
MRAVLRAAALLAAAAASATVSLDGYDDIGPGYCTKAGGPRVQTVLCDDSGAAGKGKCAYTQQACAALCTADSQCTGYMTQDMSQYKEPPTCALVTPTAPSGAQWVVQNSGGGFSIGAHDGETRDHCYKKSGTPGPPGPPAPPAPPAPGPPGGGCFQEVGNGYCVATSGGSNRCQNYFCDDSSLHPDTCPQTQTACAALCAADSKCSGYVMQDMSMYNVPTTCALVTPTKPTVAGNWVLSNSGGGFSIGGHDTQQRDTCYKKASGPPCPPGPPGPPPAPGPPPPGPPPGPGPASGDDFVLVLQARFAWWRAGTSASGGNGTTLTLAPYGLPPITVRGIGSPVSLPSKLTASNLGYCGSNSSQACIAFALRPGQPVTFSTITSDSSATTLAALAANKQALLQSYTSNYGEFAWAAEAVGAAVGWNFKFNPSEMGPHLPVSPSWDGPDDNGYSNGPPPKLGYVSPYADFEESGSFGWDCTFASYLASLGSKKMAYSGLITIVKAKTSNGFMPNCATAGAKSQDRTEPTAGAKVLLELWKKYQDKWIVKLLFDDLLDANNWAIRERTRAPLGLIALGSSTAQFNYKSGSTTEFSCDRSDQNTGCMQAMQNSRYESGQDNVSLAIAISSISSTAYMQSLNPL